MKVLRSWRRLRARRRLPRSGLTAAAADAAAAAVQIAVQIAVLAVGGDPRPCPRNSRTLPLASQLEEGGEDAQTLISPRGAQTPEYPEPLPVSPPPVNGAEIAPPAQERASEPVAPIAPPQAAAPTPEPAPQPVAPREPTEVVITQADPDRPKKGGWWQRVRTPFGS